MNLRALEHRSKIKPTPLSITIDNITKISPTKGDILVIESDNGRDIAAHLEDIPVLTGCTVLLLPKDTSVSALNETLMNNAGWYRKE